MNFYWYFIFSAIVVSSCLLLLTLNSSLYTYIFPDQEVINIWIVYVLAIALMIKQILDSMTDACGLTRFGIILTTLVRVLGLGLIIIIFYVFDVKNLLGVYVWQFFMVFLSIVGLTLILIKKGIPLLPFLASIKSTKELIRPYLSYSGPLFLLSIAGMPLSYFGRWLLQLFGGSLEQGYFSFSNTISAFIILFSNSLLPLLTREFSISNNNKNMARMKYLFTKSLYSLFAFSTFMSVFIMLQASKVTILIAGEAFNQAVLPVSVMMLYAIPYVVNNILYAIIYSTDKTKLLSYVSLSFAFINIIMSFFLLAPSKYWGLNLGALGYALSSVIGTSMIYLVLLKFVVSYLNLSWRKIIINHLIVISVIVTLGIITVKIGDYFSSSLIISFIISGVIYSIFVLGVALRFPMLFGFSNGEIFMLIKQGIHKIRHR